MQHEIGIIALAAALPTVALVIVWIQLRANDRAAQRRHEESLVGLKRLRGGAEVVVGNRGRITPPEGVAVRDERPGKSIEQIAAELCPSGPRPARELAEARGYRCDPADTSMLGGLGMATGFHIPGAVIYQPGMREERSILEGLAEAALEEEGHEPTAANVETLVALMTRPVAVRSASL